MQPWSTRIFDKLFRKMSDMIKSACRLRKIIRKKTTMTVTTHSMLRVRRRNARCGPGLYPRCPATTCPAPGSCPPTVTARPRSSTVRVSRAQRMRLFAATRQGGVVADRLRLSRRLAGSVIACRKPPASRPSAFHGPRTSGDGIKEGSRWRLARRHRCRMTEGRGPTFLTGADASSSGMRPGSSRVSRRCTPCPRPRSPLPHDATNGCHNRGP